MTEDHTRSISNVISVAVNAWMADHIHGEDSCAGCENGRGPAGHDLAHRAREALA